MIAWGNSREETIARLRRALEEYTITGIKTNAGLFRRILNEPEFLRGEIHTKWLDQLLTRKQPAVSNEEKSAADVAAIAAALWQASQSDRSAATQTPAQETPSRWKQEGRRAQLDRMP
jgi:acetyl/propionyl-CoA carboxylase alpha subunit